MKRVLLSNHPDASRPRDILQFEGRQLADASIDPEVHFYLHRMGHRTTASRPLGPVPSTLQFEEAQDVLDEKFSVAPAGELADDTITIEPPLSPVALARYRRIIVYLSCFRTSHEVVRLYDRREQDLSGPEPVPNPGLNQILAS